MIPRCESCPVAEPGACYPRRANVRRMCERPGDYGESIARWGADGGPGGDGPDLGPALVLAGYPPCRHREGKWTCGGDLVARCKLGLGDKGGIVDAGDCLPCAAIEAPIP